MPSLLLIRLIDKLGLNFLMSKKSLHFGHPREVIYGPLKQRFWKKHIIRRKYFEQMPTNLSVPFDPLSSFFSSSFLSSFLLRPACRIARLGVAGFSRQFKYNDLSWNVWRIGIKLLCTSRAVTCCRGRRLTKTVRVEYHVQCSLWVSVAITIKMV